MEKSFMGMRGRRSVFLERSSSLIDANLTVAARLGAGLSSLLVAQIAADGRAGSVFRCNRRKGYQTPRRCGWRAHLSSLHTSHFPFFPPAFCFSFAHGVDR